ncbi:hypothetical protein [Streptomyces sp. YIM 130001]|uniref:hypothetical protein n=1 Tax=Streptomyces sp. YIM 130001 TaxID=2259644 RepID=UPI0013C40126|nr:hypothetical protein [Streptomyces sp. YIM 130001]
MSLAGFAVVSAACLLILPWRFFATDGRLFSDPSDALLGAVAAACAVHVGVSAYFGYRRQPHWGAAIVSAPSTLCVLMEIAVGPGLRGDVALWATLIWVSIPWTLFGPVAYFVDKACGGRGGG